MRSNSPWTKIDPKYPPLNRARNARDSSTIVHTRIELFRVTWAAVSRTFSNWIRPPILAQASTALNAESLENPDSLRNFVEELHHA